MMLMLMLMMPMISMMPISHLQNFLFSDALPALLPSGHPGYPDPMRERELRERSALVQSAFSISSLYPPNALLPPHPPDHYIPPSLGPPPPPSSFAATPRATPDLISPSLPSPHQRPRDPSPKVLPGLPSSTFSPHSRGSSPFLPPPAPSTNNSGLAEKLKAGFGDRSPQTGCLAKPRDTSPQHSSRDPSPSVHRRAGDPFPRALPSGSSGLHTTTQANHAPTLVTSSQNHPSEFLLILIVSKKASNLSCPGEMRPVNL